MNALRAYKSRWHFVAGILLAAVVVQLLWFWGGAAQIPQVGPALIEGAEREGPLRLTYMTVGRWLTRASGTKDAAIASAQRTLTDEGLRAVTETPENAMDIVSSREFGGAHLWLKVNEWAAPVLLLAWILLYATRNRAVHFTASRR
jgi:hypothetical protein